MLQEHNLKSLDNVHDSFKSFFHIYINPSINSKGGTAIIIKLPLSISIIDVENSADSRIMSLRILYCNQELHLLNIYAHSGNHFINDREHLFSSEILYYLRRNLTRTIIGGDFNCIISKNDATTNNCHLSKALTTVVRELRLNDVCFIKNRKVEFTFVKKNYKSRIDRIYVKDLADVITCVKTIHTNLSDHSCVCSTFDIQGIPKKGTGFWKLNTRLLEDPDIKTKFTHLWCSLKLEIHNFPDINVWWDKLVKEKIKVFFMNEGKIANQKRHGLIKYLECSLHYLYNENSDKYDEIRILKGRIDSLKNEILEGVKIRGKMTEQVEGEKVSAYLIGKKSMIKSKQMITSLNKVNENNVHNINNNIVNTKNEINMYVSEFYKNLYEEKNCDSQMQNYFLSQIQSNITDSENDDLIGDVDEVEVFKIIKNMNTNRSPGIDGIPLEFFIFYWEIIKSELCCIYNTIIDNLRLEENQNIGVVHIGTQRGKFSFPFPTPCPYPLHPYLKRCAPSPSLH